MTSCGLLHYDLLKFQQTSKTIEEMIEEICVTQLM